MLEWMSDNWKDVVETGAWVVFFASAALKVVARVTKNKTDDKLVGWMGTGLKWVRKVAAMLSLNVKMPPAELPEPDKE